jgi:hypothetical protein
MCFTAPLCEALKDFEQELGNLVASVCRTLLAPFAELE